MDDVLALEEPLEIRLDFQDGISRREKSISITMRTPGNDRDLALGFLYTEGIIRIPSQVIAVEGCGPKTGPHMGQNIVKVRLDANAQITWPKLERHFYATSSCGVCGKASLDALEVQGVSEIEPSKFAAPSSLISNLSAKMRERQSIFNQTGGIHAAALFDKCGNLVSLREDVGRHNALDKLIGGQLNLKDPDFSERLLFLSGRASFELIQKAVVAGIPFVAAVGAPSSLAVELAKKFGITLLGFVRDERFNVYSGAWRLKGDPL